LDQSPKKKEMRRDFVFAGCHFLRVSKKTITTVTEPSATDLNLSEERVAGIRPYSGDHAYLLADKTQQFLNRYYCGVLEIENTPE